MLLSRDSVLRLIDILFQIGYEELVWSARGTRVCPKRVQYYTEINLMNVFEEFIHLVKELEAQKVRYALVGGVAMAFYHQPRFTRDIDLLIDSEDYEKTKAILEREGYFESASPWTFKSVPIELHRFLKVTTEDEMPIDILIAKTDEVRRMIQASVEAESEEGRVKIVSRENLIWLKKKRNSQQDKADIEMLEDEKIR